MFQAQRNRKIRQETALEEPPRVPPIAPEYRQLLHRLFVRNKKTEQLSIFPFLKIPSEVVFSRFRSKKIIRMPSIRKRLV